ncbi:MAG: PatB family C-S lyase [Gammaproteobacteria bacterium]|nr:PatB family C-S lyase [Gammaproteobacteria bacterium]
MPVFDFDTVYDRRVSSSSKWVKYGERDILPFWVADMDFATPEFILDAIRSRLDHPVIGYTELPEELAGVFIDWAERRFGWRIHPDWLVAFTSLVPGLNAAVRCVGDDGDASVVMTPIYPPFLKTAAINHREQIRSPLQLHNDQWVMDFDDIESKTSDKSSRTVMLSNPQNPTGRIYTRDELQALAEICLRTNTAIVSDEIHWGICLEPGSTHIPLATLGEEIEENTITLISHTKSYNIAGLQSAFAVIRNPELRERFDTAKNGWMSSVSPLAYAAAIAAYSDNSTWLDELQTYLRANRDILTDSVRKLPNLSMAPVEGTHLGWIDARKIPVSDHAAYFESHGLGFSDGVEFGAPGFVRFNFATPQSVLKRGISRLETASACAPTSN